MQPVKYSITDAALGELKIKYKEVPDVSTKEGYEAIRLGIAEIRTLRTGIEQHRKELKADALEYGRKVDGEAKRITEALLSIEIPYRDAKSTYDEQQEAEKQAKIEAERQRKAAILTKINDIRNIPVNHATSKAKEINEALDLLTAHDVSEGYDEFVDDAITAKNDVLETLGTLLEGAEDREKADAKRAEEQTRLDAERFKLEEDRKAQEEKQRHLEEESEARRKAEQEKLDEAKRKLEEREAIQRAKEEQERLDKEKAEREKAEAIEKERLEKERVKAEKADKKLQEERKKEAIKALVGVCEDVKTAEKVFDAIVSGKVPHITYSETRIMGEV